MTEMIRRATTYLGQYLLEAVRYGGETDEATFEQISGLHLEWWLGE